MHNHKRKNFAVSLSVISNTILIVIKLLIGLTTGSVSIISEAIHSGIDLLAAIIAWFTILASSKPADTRHPYGHGKFENISGTIEALLIFIAGIWIIFEAMQKVFHPSPLAQLDLGIMVMACSSLLNLFISNYLLKVGKVTESIAITADAWHLRTDVYTSAGVMLALIIVQIAHKFWPSVDLHLVDPITAIIVAILIIHVAIKLTMQSILDLTDVAFPEPEIQWLNDYLSSLAPTVHGFHNLRTRKAGPSRFIEVHVVVDGKMSVTASHEITREISNKIRDKFGEANIFITVHIEPCNEQHPSINCSAHC